MPAYRGNTKAAKVTAEQVLSAREKYATGKCTQASLAKALGIGIVQMGRILRGESWMNVPAAPAPFDEAASLARLRAANPDLAIPESPAMARLSADIAAKRAEERIADSWLEDLPVAEE